MTLLPNMGYRLLLVLYTVSHLSNAMWVQSVQNNRWLGLTGVSAHRQQPAAHQIIFRQDEFYNGHPSCLSPIAPPVQNATKSFWLGKPEDNPLADEGSRGPLPEEADICIIGSGITGVSAAWHLSQTLKGHKDNTSVVVLEAREFCEWRFSVSNDGCLVYGCLFFPGSGATGTLCNLSESDKTEIIIHSSTGRNGGHLQPYIFSGFRSRQAKYNTSEAVKSYIIEEYTANALVKFLKERNLVDAVDLFEGGRITLFRTPEEELESRRDFAAAAAAGLNLSSVRWISNRELIGVRMYSLILNVIQTSLPLISNMG